MTEVGTVISEEEEEEEDQLLVVIKEMPLNSEEGRINLALSQEML